MATSEDERYDASDAEVDSEVEDNEMDTQLGHWLQQLQSAAEGVEKKMLPKRIAITERQVIESFRKSIMMNGGGDIDLDAILGDLCALEAQITTQQQDIDSDLQKKTSDMNHTTTSSKRNTNQPTFDYAWDDAIDSELQGALDSLSELTASGNHSSRTNSSGSSCGGVTHEENVPTSSSDVNLLACSDTSSQTGTIKRQPASNGSSHSSGSNNNNKKPPLSPTRGHSIATTTFPVQVVGDQKSNRLSEGALINGGSTYQNFEQDLSPVSLEIDSAFSDTLSLPSSGSHGSVATSGSQHSGGSQNSSGHGSGGDGPPISPNEQANKMKAEKIKIAIEKMKEANIKKLFVRAHTADGCSKSILADEHMTVGHVCDILMAKNHVDPNLHWALIEQNPELQMERLMEDHDNLVEHMFYWARDSPNKILFVERTDKYEMFAKPEKYLVPEKKTDEEYSEIKREGLIKEYFDESHAVAPELEGMLYLKAEGKKAWKKFFFVLRSSGIYYNPKGKGKSSKDLVCLQKFDFADIYVGINWKKKFKAPTDYGFALKHPQIQKKSKYIKYVAVDDGPTLQKWVTGIRIAKYGCKLRQNYEAMKQNITTFNYRDVVPNPNFNDYIAKHNEVVEHYSKTGHRISKTEETVPDFGRRATSMRESRSSLKQNRHSSASIASGSSRSSVHSGGSSSNRSPVKVVIPPPRRSSLGDVLSDDEDRIQIVQTATSVDMYSSSESKSSVVMMKDCSPASSSSSLSRQQDTSEYDVTTLRRGSDLIKREEAAVRRGSSEAFEDIPSCGIPSLPVNTKVTKLITDQHALSGTLRKPSQVKKIRKSLSKGSDLDVTDLPPPPPDPLNDIDSLPPPPDDMLLPPPPSSRTLEGISTSFDSSFHTSPRQHTRAPSAGCVPVNNMQFQHPQQPLYQQPYEQQLHQQQQQQPSAGYVPVNNVQFQHQQQPLYQQPYEQSQQLHHQQQQQQQPLLPQQYHQQQQSQYSHHYDEPCGNGSLHTTGVSHLTNTVRSAPTTPKKSPKPPPPPPKKTEIGFGHQHQSNSSYSMNQSSSMQGFGSPTHTHTAAPPTTAPKTSYFINDLQRVLNEKHTRAHQPVCNYPPEPPLPYQSRMDLNPEPSFDDLPPPPAELLEGLRHFKKKPPPPPKRKM